VVDEWFPCIEADVGLSDHQRIGGERRILGRVLDNEYVFLIQDSVRAKRLGAARLSVRWVFIIDALLGERTGRVAARFSLMCNEIIRCLCVCVSESVAFGRHLTLVASSPALALNHCSFFSTRDTRHVGTSQILAASATRSSKLSSLSVCMML
jgi:hypothetical protein